MALVFRLMPTGIAIAVLGTVLFCWQAVSAPLFSEGLSDSLIALGRLAGLIAALLLLGQVLIITRASWLERIYGLDRLSRVHRWNAGAILLLAGTHAGSLIGGYAGRKELSWPEQFWDFFENWDAVNLACGGVAILVITVLLSSRLLPFRPCYSVWYGLHLLVYPAVVLVAIHQFETGPTANEQPFFYYFWWLLLLLTALQVAYARLIYPAWRNYRQQFAVRRVVPEGRDVNSVMISGRELAACRPGAWHFKAGQFVLVRFWQWGFFREEHPFSLSLAPGQGLLRLTIKASGDFTKRIPQLRVGTRVWLDGPFGILTTESCRAGSVALYAGGIGITPLRALAEEFLAAGIKVILLYSNRNQSCIALRDEVEQLAREKGLTLHYIFTQDPAWTGEHGRWDAARIQRLVPDYLTSEHYLCGPPPWMDLLEKLLRQLGVPRSRIHSERFAL